MIEKALARKHVPLFNLTNPQLDIFRTGESPHPHRLNVDEGADAVVGAFASVAAFLAMSVSCHKISVYLTIKKHLFTEPRTPLLRKREEL